jgi:hypothetical protein
MTSFCGLVLADAALAADRDGDLIEVGWRTSCCFIRRGGGPFFATDLVPAAAATAAAAAAALSELVWLLGWAPTMAGRVENAWAAPWSAALGLPSVGFVGTSFGGHDSALEVMEPFSLYYRWV